MCVGNYQLQRVVNIVNPEKGAELSKMKAVAVGTLIVKKDYRCDMCNLGIRKTQAAKNLFGCLRALLRMPLEMTLTSLVKSEH